MNLGTITPLILTYNEASNINRTLQRLTWAKEIIIIDSYSTDETLDIIAAYPQARVIQHPFESFADQCNFGLLQIFVNPWFSQKKFIQYFSLSRSFSLTLSVSSSKINSICSIITS